MSTPKLTPEELDALVSMARERAVEAPVVEPRDFRAPRRLSVDQLAQMVSSVGRALPEGSAHLSSWLRCDCRLEVQALVESTLDLATEGLADPLCAFALDCGGEEGLLLWDASTAVAASECALGGAPAADLAGRALTNIEARMVEQLLAPLAKSCAKALGGEVKSLRHLPDAAAALKLRGAAGGAGRVLLQLALDSNLGPSSLRILLAKTKAPEIPAAALPAKGAKQALPPAFGAVDVGLGVHLGDVEVPLADLLALEVGDVIPLELELDGVVDVHVEGRRCMTARIGHHQGRLALRIAALQARELSI
ncbi:MAG: Type flagellar switch regulator (C-ring) FliN C-term [Planctomycetota bacterium]|jgi:flagellar motor switch protein FliM